MRPYLARAILVTFVTCLTGVNPGVSQSLLPGDTIRVDVRMPEGYGREVVPFYGTFGALEDNRLRINVPTGKSLSISVDSVAGIAIRKARTARAGALRGALWGGLGFGLLGFVLGATSPEPDSGPLISEAIDTGLMSGAVLAIPGILIGGRIGSARPGSHWKRLPFHQLQFGAGSTGNVEVVVRLHPER